jgi:glycosyltransferase involved in cell wall biosynthesis
VPPLESAEEELADDVTRFHVPSLQRSLNPLRDVAAFLSLYQLCRREKFDIVHTHNSKDGFLGRWAAHLAGIPAIVHTIHNIPFRASRFRFPNKIYEIVERLTASVTASLVAVSRENVRAYLAHGIGKPKQFRVVYSGLELGKYLIRENKAEARRMLGLASEGHVAGWFGRLNYQKDPLTFIRAAQLMANVDPSIQFLVCGEDPIGENLHPQVRQLVENLGLRERVRFMGFRSDLPLVLTAVDCVMHSSRYEGMGRTICEALLCKRAVAGTNVDGVLEVIVSGQRGGLLVNPEDPRALADAALTLLQQPERARQLAEAGYAWVKANLSADKMIADIVNVYNDLLPVIRKRTSAPQLNGETQ